MIAWINIVSQLEAYFCLLSPGTPIAGEAPGMYVSSNFSAHLHQKSLQQKLHRQLLCHIMITLLDNSHFSSVVTIDTHCAHSKPCHEASVAAGRFKCAKCTSPAKAAAEYCAELLLILAVNAYLIVQLAKPDLEEFDTAQGSDYLQACVRIHIQT